jgi:twinkle protein
MRFYSVPAKINEEGEPVELAFFYPNGNVKIRNLASKAFHTEKGKPLEGLFGRNKFAAGSHDYVTITEGELDACSLYQALGRSSPVVSVQSAATALRDCRVDRDWLNSFKRIYLAFDADAPGREATAAVAKLFDPTKVFHVKFSNRKDANEYLEAGEQEVLATIWKNSKRYLPEEIRSSFEDFEKILTEPVKESVPYPFKGLNDLLYGIRMGETVLITAQEKVGKTELMHFIEYQLLTETDHNVGAIFLEEQPVRHLQALAGIRDKVPYHLPDAGDRNADVLRAVQDTVKKDDRLYLYTHFGSNDPDNLLDTIRYLVSACGCKFILFDHLSILISGNTGKEDERKVIDYVVTRLEMMVKELNFALIMVMHVNDNGQTRSSRFPTKVADVTIGAFRDLQNPDPVERSTVYLRVLFNRPASTTGPACALTFNRDTYSFEEKPFNDHGHPGTQVLQPSNDNVQVPSGQEMAA